MVASLDKEGLCRAVAAGEVFQYRFFWGHRPRKDGALSDSCFSQWWGCRFEADGEVYTSAEQYMMAQKAKLFGDEEMRRAILQTDDPSSAKKLGRKVRGFDEAQWKSARFDIVTHASLAKFGQDEGLKRYLLATREEVLVEASPTDRIWGIGLGRDDPRAADPHTWQGLNLLGFALCRAREMLRTDQR